MENKKRGNCIVLIGMPGAGKTTLGVRIAKLLNKDFLDTDDVILEQTGLKTGALAESCDFDTFIEKESQAVQSVSADNAVIATGGSVIYSDEGMKHLQRLGTIIYIYLPFEITMKRAGDYSARGVVIPPGSSKTTYFNQRHKLYRKYADFIFAPKRESLSRSAKHLSGLSYFLLNSQDQLDALNTALTVEEAFFDEPLSLTVEDEPLVVQKKKQSSQNSFSSFKKRRKTQTHGERANPKRQKSSSNQNRGNDRSSKYPDLPKGVKRERPPRFKDTSSHLSASTLGSGIDFAQQHQWVSSASVLGNNPASKSSKAFVKNSKNKFRATQRPRGTRKIKEQSDAK